MAQWCGSWETFPTTWHFLQDTWAGGSGKGHSAALLHVSFSRPHATTWRQTATHPTFQRSDGRTGLLGWEGTGPSFHTLPPAWLGRQGQAATPSSAHPLFVAGPLYHTCLPISFLGTQHACACMAWRDMHAHTFVSCPLTLAAHTLSHAHRYFANTFPTKQA